MRPRAQSSGMTNADLVDRLSHVSSLCALLGSVEAPDESALRRFIRSSSACSPPWPELAGAARALQQQTEHSLTLRDSLNCLAALRRVCAESCEDHSTGDLRTESTPAVVVQWACVLHVTLGVLLRYGQDVAAKAGRPAKKPRGKQAPGSTAQPGTLTPKQLEQVLDACIACSEHYWAAAADGSRECDACPGILVSIATACCQLAGGGSTAQAAALHGRLCGFLPNTLAVDSTAGGESAWRYPTSAASLCHGLLTDPLQAPLLQQLLSTLSDSRQDDHRRALAAVCCTVDAHLTQLASSLSKGKASSQAASQGATLLKQLAVSPLPVLAMVTAAAPLLTLLTASAAAVRKGVLACVQALADHLLADRASTPAAAAAQPTRSGALRLVPTATAHPPRHTSAPDDCSRDDCAAAAPVPAHAPTAAIQWACKTLAHYATEDRDATCRKQACASVTSVLLDLFRCALAAGGDTHIEACAGGLVATLRAAVARDAAKTVRAEAFKGLAVLCFAIARSGAELAQASDSSVRADTDVGRACSTLVRLLRMQVVVAQ